MHLETVGSGPRIVLVHGSVGAGRATWSEQLALAERFELAIVTRSGYPPNPPLERIDFEDQAEELAGSLEPGDHLVGHSYGGVVSLLAAGRRPEALASLTVVEPPAFGLVHGHPAVEAFLAEMGAFAERGRHTAREYLAFFLPLVGSTLALPDPLPEPLEAGGRAAMAERWPSEADVPVAALAAGPFPKLVVSGAHSPAFDAVCDVLEQGLPAQRAVLPGAGHSVPRLGGPFNALLAAFVDSTSSKPAK